MAQVREQKPVCRDPADGFEHEQAAVDESAAGTTAVDAASASHRLAACCWKRRIQNWPRW
jgi:hypothetical protein